MWYNTTFIRLHLVVHHLRDRVSDDTKRSDRHLLLHHHHPVVDTMMMMNAADASMMMPAPDHRAHEDNGRGGRE